MSKKTIDNKNLSEWQLQELQDWNGKNIISFYKGTVRKTIFMSDAKIAECLQEVDLVQFLLDKVGAPTETSEGLPLLSISKRLEYLLGARDKPKAKDENPKKNKGKKSKDSQ